MIGYFNCPITGVWFQPTIWLHCPITTVKNDKWKKKAAYVSITFEEIVMVMTVLVTDMLLICIIRKVYTNYDTSSASGIFPRRDRDSMITIMKWLLSASGSVLRSSVT